MKQNIKIPFVDLYSQNKELRAEIDLEIFTCGYDMKAKGNYY